MDLSIRHVSAVMLKTFLAIVGLLVLIIAGLLAYMEFKSRPPGSPPPGFEDRVKYQWDDTPGPYSSRKVPIDLWYGRRDGQYDTTHLRIDSDYSALVPHYHGEGAHINIIWPSLRSPREEDKFREKEGLTYKRKQYLTLVFTEANPTGSGDKSGTDSFHECEPRIHDEVRGVKYCNEKRKIDTSVKRFTNYWPLDKTILTPWYKNLPKAHCYVVERPGKKRFDACTIRFSYNVDVDVTMSYVPEQLAIEILSDFTRLTDFLNTLEVKP